MKSYEWRKVNESHLRPLGSLCPRHSAAWLAGVAARPRDKAGLIACNAHWLEALHALAAGWGACCRLGGIWAWSFHGGVAVKSDGLVISKACWAALARHALQHEGRDTLDIR